jgi:predicted nucleic acid-binding protein
MLVVDASCLYEVVAGTPGSEPIRERLAADADLNGQLDATAAVQAVEDLRDWPGERFGHRSLVVRAWELRASVRSWDALYVALAEALGAILVTTDARLAAAHGPECEIEVGPPPREPRARDHSGTAEQGEC